MPKESKEEPGTSEAGDCNGCSSASCHSGHPGAKKGATKAQEEAMIKRLGQQLMTMQTNNTKNVPKSTAEAQNRNYQFWSTQPVPSFTANTEVRTLKFDYN